MKNSTILGFGILAIAGAGAYIYLKGKKVAVVNDVASSTPPPTPPPSTPPSSTSSVADNTLGLTPKPTIDTVVSVFSETQTENYKKAKELSKNIEILLVKIDFYKTNKTKNNIRREIADKTKQANALGYKILPYGEIEKM
jgi:hypothetical protein